MWVYARKTMFCKGAATPGLNKVGGIMIKASAARSNRPVGAVVERGARRPWALRQCRARLIHPPTDSLRWLHGL